MILRDVKVGMKTPRQMVRMDFDQNMGELYPFSLRDKLKAITEPSPFYEPERASANRWGRAIIPLSVPFQYSSRQDRLPIKGPAVGLFADQEIRLIAGPLFVGESYDLDAPAAGTKPAGQHVDPVAHLLSHTGSAGHAKSSFSSV